MCRADDRRARAVGELGEQRPDLDRRGGVEPRRRLVGDDDGRPRGERTRQGDALALPGREEIDAPLGVGRVRARPTAASASAARSFAAPPSTPRKREAELDVLTGGEEAREARNLPDDGYQVATERGA